MLQIAGGWVTITTVRIAAWIIWLQRHSLLYVLSKASIPSALLKIRRIIFKYEKIWEIQDISGVRND